MNQYTFACVGISCESTFFTQKLIYQNRNSSDIERRLRKKINFANENKKKSFGQVRTTSIMSHYFDPMLCEMISMDKDDATFRIGFPDQSINILGSKILQWGDNNIISNIKKLMIFFETRGHLLKHHSPLGAAYEYSIRVILSFE